MTAFVIDHFLGWLAAAVGLITVIVGAVMAGHRSGRKAAEIEALVKDQRHADAIRNRLDNDRAARLRANDDAGFRD